MEAKNKTGKARLNSVLQPISRNLTDAEVLELYHSGRGIFVESEEEEEVTMMMHKAINRTMRCSRFIAKGKTREDIHSYYQSIFGGEDRKKAVECMQNARKRKQFVCEQAGALMVMGVIYADTHEVAKALGYTSITLETAMRYIRHGKQILRDF